MSDKLNINELAAVSQRIDRSELAKKQLAENKARADVFPIQQKVNSKLRAIRHVDPGTYGATQIMGNNLQAIIDSIQILAAEIDKLNEKTSVITLTSDNAITPPSDPVIRNNP